MTDDSRQVTLVRVEAEIRGPWAVGAARAGLDINQPVAHDPRDPARGTPLLPATTLVGSLRAHLNRTAGGRAYADEWLGSPVADRPSSDEPPPNGLPSDDPAPANPSKLWALGAIVASSSADRRVARRTSINAQRAAATAKTLHSRERIEPDDGAPTRVRFVLEHEGPADLTLLGHLAGWRAAIGAQQSIGQGDFAVTEVAAVTANLEVPAHLTWWLTDRALWITVGRTEPSDTAAPPTDAVRHVVGSTHKPAPNRQWRWRILEPIHVGGEASWDDSDETDDRVAPERKVQREPSSAPRTAKPVIPGTSWKGVFRHRATSILRIVGLTETEIDKAVAVLFGAAPRHRDRTNPGRRGALRFSDSKISGVSGGVSTSISRSHVAIDRITGGAADGKLFTMEGVESGTFTLSIGAFTEIPECAQALIEAVVRDLHEGILGIGAATTRGYGRIELVGDPLAHRGIDVTALRNWISTIDLVEVS